MKLFKNDLRASFSPSCLDMERHGAAEAIVTAIHLIIANSITVLILFLIPFWRVSTDDCTVTYGVVRVASLTAFLRMLIVAGLLSRDGSQRERERHLVW